MSKVVSVNISKKKGTIKTPVDEITLNETGVMHDAHAGQWNRQVSLLGIESIQKFSKQLGRNLSFGEFAENITTEGINLFQLHPLDTLSIGESVVEVTQIGKKCHGTSCQIFKETGDCIMPTEGIFGRVIKQGKIITGMPILYESRCFKVLIITLSDRASQGQYEDRSGPIIKTEIKNYFENLSRKYEISHEIIPDDPISLEKLLQQSHSFDIVITNGSTGIGPRDIAPDVISKFMDKGIPGIMEMIRVKYGADKPGALLSRSVAGMKGQTLIYTLPGSPKAVKEYIQEILRTLQHALYMIHGLDIH